MDKLKEVVKNLTIKCVQLAEQSKKLTVKVDGQQKQISRLTDKVMEQSDTIDRLQEKASDLGRLERHFGREQVQSIVERSKALEQAERANKILPFQIVLFLIQTIALFAEFFHALQLRPHSLPAIRLYL